MEEQVKEASDEIDLNVDEPGKPIEDDGFTNSFHQKAEAGGLKPVAEANVRSTIGSSTYEGTAGKLLRFTKDGHSLVVDIWPAGSEEMMTSTPFAWNGKVWEQPDIKLTFTSAELAGHLISSLNS